MWGQKRLVCEIINKKVKFEQGGRNFDNFCKLYIAP
jgi:hypothetical protein